MALSAQDKQQIVEATIQGVMQQLRGVIRNPTSEHRGETSAGGPPAAPMLVQDTTAEANSQLQSGKPHVKHGQLFIRVLKRAPGVRHLLYWLTVARE